MVMMLNHPVVVEVFQSEQKWWSNQPRAVTTGEVNEVVSSVFYLFCVSEVFKNLKNKNFRFQNFYNSVCNFETFVWRVEGCFGGDL